MCVYAMVFQYAVPSCACVCLLVFVLSWSVFFSLHFSAPLTSLYFLFSFHFTFEKLCVFVRSHTPFPVCSLDSVFSLGCTIKLNCCARDYVVSCVARDLCVCANFFSSFLVQELKGNLGLHNKSTKDINRYISKPHSWLIETGLGSIRSGQFYCDLKCLREWFHRFHLKFKLTKLWVCLCVSCQSAYLRVNPIFNNKYWNVYRFQARKETNTHYKLKQIYEEISRQRFPSCVGVKEKFVSI